MEFEKLSFTDEQIGEVAVLLGLPVHAFLGLNGSDPRQAALRTMDSVDVAACPGSGKTTLLVAKLALLERQWMSQTRGICVLSHTNVARQEVESLLGNSIGGRRLLGYPHYIGTIHGFVNEFLALPYLRSVGYPVKVIDNDIALDRRWNNLSYRAQKGLEHNNLGPGTLIIRAPDGSIGDVRWGKQSILGRNTATYLEIVKVCLSSVREGLYCYEEMFVWAHALLDRAPNVVQTIRSRFPIVFMDEAQDTDEEQSSILSRIFSAGPSPVIRQRFGDANQAIFNRFDHISEATTDPFPASPIIQLPSSPRFGQSIASLADPLGVTPQGLIGCGPKRPLDSGGMGEHTLFLFSDSTVPKVLDAYGQLLVETFSETELRQGVFTAIGQVHRIPASESSNHYPHHLGHYWPQYTPELSSRDPKPTSFVQCLRASQAAGYQHGESFIAVDRIAAGVLQLANVKGNLGSAGRKHLAICEALRGNEEALKAYHRLIATFATRREDITAQGWESQWRDAVATIVSAIPDSSFSKTDAAAHPFMAWNLMLDSMATTQTRSVDRGNIYDYPAVDPKVHIRAGSIHSMKGETHTATLVLETHWHKHNLCSLLRWIDGTKSGGKGAGKRDTTRLQLHYVAMTRPTHLLCLAFHRAGVQLADGTMDQAVLGRLRNRGWHIQFVD